MYICIEGIKGSGKSSLVQALQARLQQLGIEHGVLKTTARRSRWHISDYIFAVCGHYWPDGWVEKLFAARSEYHWRHRQRRVAVLLGDRSVLTSYVTRFDMQKPELALWRVDALEPSIHLPDHVFYLDLAVASASQRLMARSGISPRRKDETPTRLVAATKAYRVLHLQATALGLSRVRWHFFNADRPREELLDACMRRILALLEIQNHHELIN